MRLINSDGQVIDARIIARKSGAASGSSARIDGGVVVLGAAVFVMLATTVMATLAWSDSRHLRDLLEVRTVAEQRAWDENLAQQRRTEVAAALADRRLKDIESYALLNGWKIPSDDQHGPLGNLERMKGDKHVRR